jgi:Holliday junction DNA helicase RuvA
MISHLRGIIDQIGEGSLVVEVGGVGFFVRVPTSLCESVEVGQVRQIPTELVVREDELSLYGFGSGYERELFRLLTSITGVGPKLALKVLGAVGPGELAHAISEEDVSFLVKIPGLGPKMARRVVVELSEKIAAVVKQSSSPTGRQNLFRESESVLCSLGCTPDEARAALERCVLQSGEDEEWTVDRLVIEAMKHLGRSED